MSQLLLSSAWALTRTGAASADGVEPGWVHGPTFGIVLLCSECCVTLILLLAWLLHQPTQQCASMVAVPLCITAVQPLACGKLPCIPCCALPRWLDLWDQQSSRPLLQALQLV